MMGEIHDEESVEALMRLSSSGHRAISTLHTNSACEVPNRLFLFRADGARFELTQQATSCGSRTLRARQVKQIAAIKAIAAAPREDQARSLDIAAVWSTATSGSDSQPNPTMMTQAIPAMNPFTADAFLAAMSVRWRASFS
jgi:hypothetical protein